MSLDQYEKKALAKVKEFFENEPGFVFEKVAGKGSFGVTSCFRNELAGLKGYQKIAVKNITWSTEEISTEIQILKSLIWAQHVVTIIEIPFQSQNTRWITNNTIITEYLENGTLNDLKNRLGTVPPRRLPNRVLWAIFLCLARGCLGMAYPPGDPTKTPRGPREQLLEALPLNVDETPQNLAHGDLHDENVMFGNLDSLEHGYFPVLKMIDFGMAVIEFGGAKDNIFAIGEMMCELIYGERDIRELIDDKKGVNTIDPNLDSELLTLAVQCNADHTHGVPSIFYILSVIRPKIRQKYPGIPEETDAYIYELVQRCIFDAK